MQFNLSGMEAGRRGRSITDDSVLLISCGIVLLYMGISAHFFPPHISRVVDLVEVALSAAIIAVVCKLALSLNNFAAVLVGLVFIFGMHGQGLYIAVDLVFVAVAISLGGRLQSIKSIEDVFVATLLGLTIIGAVVGWLLPFNVNYAQAYAVFAILTIFQGRQFVVQSIKLAGGLLDGESPTISSLALLVAATAIFAILLCWPLVNYDDLALHAGISSQLLKNGYYNFDASSQFWANMPWLNDVLHAIITVVSGHTLPGALNAIWLILSVGMIFFIVKNLGGEARLSLAISAVIVSQPMMNFLATSMQVELATLCYSLAVVAVLTRREQKLNGSVLVILLSGLLALKITGALLVAPVMLYALVTRRIDMDAKSLAKYLLLGFFVSIPSYLWSEVVSGNPILPLFNEIFKSRYFPIENFRDPSWGRGISFRKIFDLAVDSSKYGEIRPGTIGVLPWIFLILVVGALIDGSITWVAIVGLIPVVAMFYEINYYRYVFPYLSAAFVYYAAARIKSSRRLGLWIVCLASIAVINSAYWYAGRWDGGRLRGLFLYKTTTASMQNDIAPEVGLLSLAALLAAPERNYAILVSDPARPYISTGAGHAYTASWYDPTLQEKYGQALVGDNSERLHKFLVANGFRFVLASDDKTKNILAHDKLSRKIAVVQNAVLWEIDDAPLKSTLNIRRNYTKWCFWYHARDALCKREPFAPLDAAGG